MTKREYMDIVEKGATEYIKCAEERILKNISKYELDSNENISQNIVDAILVDFVNFLGLYQGLDEGYTIKDLYEKR